MKEQTDIRLLVVDDQQLIREGIASVFIGAEGDSLHSKVNGLFVLTL